MDGLVLFIIATSVLVLSLLSAVAIGLFFKKKSVFKPLHLIMIGAFLSGILLFAPIYIDAYNGFSLKSLLLSIHNTIRLFVVDADFNTIIAFSQTLDGSYSNLYQIISAVLFVLAPILSFGVVLSLFKDVFSSIKLFFCFFKDVYVFSDLNERSIALAKDISKEKKRAVIVFADISENKGETNDLLEKASEFGAISFKKSITALNFKSRLNRRKVFFFAISSNEDENVSKSSELVKKYKDKKNAELYVFSSSRQGELFLDSIGTKHLMKIRRIGEQSCLINRFLYDNGHEIINSAHAEEDGLKVISAVVIGMGGYGTEMAKALPWFCQFSGYRFKMNAFDKDEHAESKFKALCPEYLSPACNKIYVDGEAQYDINVHSDMDYTTVEFGEKLQEIKDASFVFISLGSDADNINCAIMTRMYFERLNIKPTIVAVVHDDEKTRLIENAKAIDSRPFDIKYTGGLEDLYSVRVIINSELEQKALKVHMKYPSANKTLEEHERFFWANEYNYKSSCASAIHNKVRVDCKIAGAEKEYEDQTEEERQIITVIEHRRWNAYVRSCGYIYSGSPEKSSRNDLAKIHNCLVPFDELSDFYKKIDTDIGLKK